jgi:hypothetical protein
MVLSFQEVSDRLANALVIAEEQDCQLALRACHDYPSVRSIVVGAGCLFT